MPESHNPHAVQYKQRSIHDYFRILLKRRWAFSSVLLLFSATATLYSFIATPVYKPTVQILIERYAPKLLDQRESTTYNYSSEEFYQTQYKLLESPALITKVINKLHLKNDPHYSWVFKELPANAEEDVKQKAEEVLIKVVQRRVEVKPIRQSSLVNLSFSNPDPQFATLVANTLAQSYIEYSLNMRFAASQEESNWLKEKMDESRKRLEDSEAKLNQYKREYRIVAAEDKESITAQKLEQLNKDLITAQTHRMEAETRFKEVSQGKPIPQVLNNQLIQTLKGQEAKIIAEQSELGKKYGEAHPRMIRLINELAATRGKIGAETNQVVQAIKNEYHMALAQEENLKKALEEHKRDTQDFSDRAIQYRVLLRDVETNRALYENILRSLKTTTATENIPPTNIRIVYPATVPNVPVSPQKSRNILVSVVLGILFGATLVVLLELLDTTLKTPEEVEEWLKIPNLSMIPHIELPALAVNDNGGPPELVVHHGTHHLVSEAYRALRTSVLFSTPGQPPQTLLITSTFPWEGKTLTAANLATAMAKAEPQVLLVDADLRRPTLHQLFGVEKDPGLTNFLVGDVNDLPVIETPVSGLFLVTCGHIPPNPSELLHSERMREFLSRAQERFGLVVIDSPPILSVTDAAILSTLVEGTLMVIKAETVPRKAAIAAKNDLVEVKAPLLGAILNDIQFQRDGYYYYYHYHYSRYHSYYESKDGGPNKSRRSRKPSPPKGILSLIKSHLPFLKRDSSRRT
jgi:capsular exopolysaccharide synthesis family protein